MLVADCWVCDFATASVTRRQCTELDHKVELYNS